MNVWIRRGAWVLAGLIVLLAAVAGWFVATFDAQRTKALAVEWMKTHRNRTLAIDGPVNLKLFPRLGVSVNRATLSEAGRPDTFASIDDAALAVDVLPLLRGELVVGRVEASGVRLVYRRNAKGQSNVDDLVKPAPEQPSERKPMRFDIDRIALRDVQVQLADEAGGPSGTLTVKTLDAGHLANRVEAPVTLDAQFDFKQPAVKGTLSGDTRLMLDTDTGSASLRETRLRFQGDAPGATAVDATLKGGVSWDGAKKRIDAQSLALVLSGHTGGLKHEGSTLAVERFAFDPARKTLTLRQLQARVKGSQGGQPVSFDLDWPELSAEGATLAGSAFSGKASRGGELPMTATFKSSAPSGSFDAVRMPVFEAHIDSKTAQRHIDGSLHSALTVRPSPASLTLDALELQARIEEEKQQPLALSAHGSAVVAAQRSTWSMSGQLNQNRFASDGTVTLAGDTPLVKAVARFDSLDLNRVLGRPATPAPSAAPSPSRDTPVDLAALRSVNGQFGFSAGHFAYQQFRVDDARADATLDAGMLRVTSLQGRIWGGQVQASAFADARASRVAVKGSANGVNVNALVKDVAAKDLIEGTGRVSWDLDTAGRSVNEMKSRLKGSAALQLRDGAIKGINLAKALRQAKAALTMKQDAAQKASQTEKTDFSELTATFQIVDGVARNRDLDVKSPLLRLGGEGSIDIGRSRIDYLARATVTGAPLGVDAGELSALKGLTVPVRLTGPFDAPDWKIEWSGVAAGLVTRQIENRLGEALGIKGPASAASKPSTEDALKKALKGLFK